jgi:hypothetical protein
MISELRPALILLDIPKPVDTHTLADRIRGLLDRPEQRRAGGAGS